MTNLNRPFAADPETRLMLLDGIFDATRGRQLIGFYYPLDQIAAQVRGKVGHAQQEQIGDWHRETTYQYVLIGLDVPDVSSISIRGAVGKPSLMYNHGTTPWIAADGNFPEVTEPMTPYSTVLHLLQPSDLQNSSILRYFDADFSNAPVGKHTLTFTAFYYGFRNVWKQKNGGIYSPSEDDPGPWGEDYGIFFESIPESGISRDAFVTRTYSDLERNVFAAEAPEGTIVVRFRKLDVWTDDSAWFRRQMTLPTPYGSVQVPLFLADVNLCSELDSGSIPSTLVGGFASAGHSLSRYASVHKIDMHSWGLKSGRDIYYVRLQELDGQEVLGVYGSRQSAAPFVMPREFTVSLVPARPFSGAHGPLPFGDPLWKIVAGIVFLAAAVYAFYSAKKKGGGTVMVPIHNKYGDVIGETDQWDPLSCDVESDITICKRVIIPGAGSSTPSPHWESTHTASTAVAAATGTAYVGGVAIALKGGAGIAALAEPVDPFRSGEANTEPGIREVTIGEVLDVEFTYSPEADYPEDPFGIGTAWRFQRITQQGRKVATRSHACSDWKPNPIVQARLTSTLSGSSEEIATKTKDGDLLLVPAFSEGEVLRISAELEPLPGPLDGIARGRGWSGSDAFVQAALVGEDGQATFALLTDPKQSGVFSGSVELHEESPVPLFSVEEIAARDKFLGELQACVFSAEFREDFKRNDVEIGRNASIRMNQGSRGGWIVDDGVHSYLAVVESGRFRTDEVINVYDQLSLRYLLIIAQSVNAAGSEDDPLTAAAHVGGLILNPVLKRVEDGECSFVAPAETIAIKLFD